MEQHYNSDICYETNHMNITAPTKQHIDHGIAFALLLLFVFVRNIIILFRMRGDSKFFPTLLLWLAGIQESRHFRVALH